MALKKCRECGNEISNKAKTCPNCGISNPTSKQYGCGSLILLGFFCIIILMLSSQSAKRQQVENQAILEKQQAKQLTKAIELKKTRIKYFNEHSSEILLEIKKAIENKEYQKATSLSSKYVLTENAELTALNKKASVEVVKLQKEQNTKKILAELKTIPMKEYGKNQKLYRQLASLNPDNETYKYKVKFYTGKIKKGEQQKLIAKRITKQAKPKVFKYAEIVNVGYTSYIVWRSLWSDRLSYDQFIDEKPDAKFLFVELTVKNNDKKARSIPPFKLIDENGAEYETTSKAWAVENSIDNLDSLNPGVEKKGVIVFDIPTGHKYKLKVSGGYWSAKYAFVQLSPKTNK